MIKLDMSAPMRDHRITLFDGAVVSLQADYSNVVGKDSTSVSSVAWDITGPVTTSNETLASNVASADITAGYSADETGTITATLANGDKIVSVLRFRVLDPDCE